MSNSLGPNLGLFINGNLGEEHYEILMRQFRGFDGLIQCHVNSKSLTVPPGGLSDGAMYIIPAGATGIWTGRTNQLARSYTLGTGAPGWEYFLPKKGWQVRVEDEGDADGVPKVYVYTGTEWKVPATPDSTAMQNPMTVAGDIIIGGTAGTPIRLPIGSEGLVLKVIGGQVAWGEDATQQGQAGMTNPMTNPGDIIHGGAGGAPMRLARGTNGQVLSLAGGYPAWIDPPSGGGMSNPMTNPGDLIIGGTAGAPARLGIGTNGQVLKVSGGSLVWGTESGGSGPASTDALAEGTTNLYFTAARVLATVLAGLSTATATAVAATDTLLVAIGKLQAQVNARVPTSALGVSVATLVSGTVPASQLPSYVDDVLEYASQAAFPATGETGKIYIALDTNRQYRWSGSAYIQLVASPGSTDAVTEGTTNLYFTAARVLATVLTGLVTNNGTVVSATDTLLVAIGKLQAQVQARLPLTGGKMTGALNYANPVQLASAATVAIGAAGAQTISITGTTTITAFDSIAAGARRRVVFDGILTLTHGATSLVLPGYANILTAVGDVAEFESMGSGNWRCTSYMRVNGRAIALGAPIPTITAATNVNIYSPGVGVVSVSGTSGIGYLGGGADGQEVTVLFASATPLWASSALLLPGGANLTTAPGDSAKFVYLGGSGASRCVSYNIAGSAPLNSATMPFVNLMPDSGRFAGRINPLSLTLTSAFASSSFLFPFNGATHASGGQFIHDNSTNGGAGGALTSAVSALLTAMGRTGNSARYGVEFFVDTITAGSGTGGPTMGTDSTTRYLLSVNSSRAVFTAGGYGTCVMWIRVRSGSLHQFAYGKSTPFKNGVVIAEGTPLTSTDGWVHLRVVQKEAIGYDSGFPGLFATPGAVIDVACVAYFGGSVDTGIHTAPLATINELSG